MSARRRLAEVSVSDLPVTLTKAEIAKVIRRSERWVEARISEGTFPIPRIRHAPGLLWSRKAVETFLHDVTFDSPEMAASTAGRRA